MKKKFLSVFAVVCCIACNGQNVDLFLKLTVGAIYNHSTTLSSAIIETINGQKQTIEMSINGDIAYQVKDIVNDSYNMEVQYKSLAMEISLLQKKKKFSSEIKDSADVLSTLLGGLKNKIFYITMSRKGKVEAVSGIDSLISNMMVNIPDLAADKKEQLKSQLMKSFGEKAFKGNIEMVTAIFPDKPVAAGNLWIVNTQLQSGIPAAMKSTYQFKGESGLNYLIHGDSRIETASDAGYVEISGMPLKYNLTGTMVSDIKISKETGWIIECVTSQQIAGTCQVKDSEKVPGGMLVPMSITTKALMTGK